MRAGDQIDGRFVLEKPLRRGGMGEIWVARDAQTDASVAIKVLRESTLGERDAVSRFVREARIAAKIDSPYAVRIHHAGELPDARGPFIVMDLLEGRDLSRVIKASGHIPVERAVTCLLQVCHAVARAHAAGIVHRDLKPSNLFLVDAGEPTERVVVLDFGISKIADDDSALTGTGDALGTPRYMPPEQIRSSRSADARADIWALGVILFELVTGTLPFEGDSGAAFLAATLSDPPRRARDLRADVPRGIDDAIDRCLRKDPQERFQTVTELALALSPFASVHAKGLLSGIDGAIRAPRPLGGTQPLADHQALLAELTLEAATQRQGRGDARGEDGETIPASRQAPTNVVEHTTQVAASTEQAQPVRIPSAPERVPMGGRHVLALALALGVAVGLAAYVVVSTGADAERAPSSAVAVTGDAAGATPPASSSPPPPVAPGTSSSVPADVPAPPASALAPPSVGPAQGPVPPGRPMPSGPRPVPSSPRAPSGPSIEMPLQ